MSWNNVPILMRLISRWMGYRGFGEVKKKRLISAQPPLEIYDSPINKLVLIIVANSSLRLTIVI
jgi:hypothetical protein